MDDTIDLLNDLALKLLEGASTLDPEIGDSEPSFDVAKEKLRELCDTLGNIETVLTPKGSLLHRLVRMIDGAKLSHSLERLSKYLADHRATLIRFQVPESLVSEYISALSGEAAPNGDNALDKPQTLELENALEPIRQLRAVVCEIANAAEVTSIVTKPEILKQVAAGCIGAATVVLDITSATAASPIDPSAWVLFKAIKSIWGGAAAVYRSTCELHGMLDKIRKAPKNTSEHVFRGKPSVRTKRRN